MILTPPGSTYEEEVRRWCVYELVHFTRDPKKNVTHPLRLPHAKETYRWASQEKRGEIPEEKRDTRAVIKAAADAYLDKFTDPNIIVPRLDPCERLEGRAHIAPNCIAGLKSGAERKMGNRRYVIDEVVGTVDVFLTFGANPDYKPNPDSHEFWVEGGKIKYVHTNSVGMVPPPKYGGIRGIGT
jgi:hypothetical protein